MLMIGIYHKLWTRRKRLLSLVQMLVASIMYIPVLASFFIHMLFNIVCGSYSFLRTHAARIVSTFVEACHARGLVGDDK
jgi:hypothetical protein